VSEDLIKLLSSTHSGFLKKKNTRSKTSSNIILRLAGYDAPSQQQMKQSRLAKIKKRNNPESKPEKKPANRGPPAPSAGGSAGSTSSPSVSIDVPAVPALQRRKCRQWSFNLRYEGRSSGRRRVFSCQQQETLTDRDALCRTVGSQYVNEIATTH
jgi:hypothetical protein